MANPGPEARQDEAPTELVKIAGKSCRLQADQRAHYTIELTTGASFYDYMAQLRKPNVPISSWFLLIWALLSAHRFEQKEPWGRLTDDDKAAGFLIPSRFVADLPLGAEWFELIALAERLVGDAWSDTLPEDPHAGKHETLPAP